MEEAISDMVKELRLLRREMARLRRRLDRGQVSSETEWSDLDRQRAIEALRKLGEVFQ